MAEVTLEVKPKEAPEPAKKELIDPKKAEAVAGILTKLPLGDMVKGLLFKLFIFGLGIFCGIGIVYKSGLPIPGDKTSPPAAVSIYQKRIEELQKENAELRKALEEPVTPKEQPKTNPIPFPLPKVNPTTPGSGVLVPKTGFVVPNK